MNRNRVELDMTFDEFFSYFKGSTLWLDMLNTRENSPYHRESSTAEHTRMCLRFYDENFSSNRSNKMELLTKLAILFHDVGKPISEQKRSSAERGDYKVYAGHEIVSARLFEDYFLSYPELFLKLKLTQQELFLVKFLIEKHLPFNLLKKEKLAAFKYDLSILDLTAERMFYDLIISDCHGRFMDEAQAKFDTLDSWIEMFSSIEPKQYEKRRNERGIVFILIGPSGSGKSTFCASIENARVISLDRDRLDFFKLIHGREGTYSEAWNYCNENASTFRPFSELRFNEVINEPGAIIIDNTNSSAKSRRNYIAKARSKGFMIKAIEFHSSLQIVISRQSTRTDKSLSEEVVRQQYLKTTVASLGYEVDEISHIFT